MGTIIISEIVQHYNELFYDKIVLIAPAMSIKDFEHTIIPYLQKPENKDTQVYIVTLHPEADANEDTFYDLLPRGSLLEWVDDFAALATPNDIVWCDGSKAEYDTMWKIMVEGGTAKRLNDEKRPNSYYVTSVPADVARVEDRTYICSQKEIDAGPKSVRNCGACSPVDVKNGRYVKLRVVVGQAQQ